MGNLRVLIDGMMGLTALYLSFCLYEIGNFISLSLVGANPSLVWSGALPVGVVSVSSHPVALSTAKFLQVCICTCALFSGWRLARRNRLPITSFILACASGLVIASPYWELVSLASIVPLAAHEAVYATLSLVLTLGLLWKFPKTAKAMRPRRSFEFRTRPSPA